MKAWVTVQTSNNLLQAELNKMESEGLKIFQVLATTAVKQQRISSEMTRDIEVQEVLVVAYRDSHSKSVDDLDDFNEAVLRIAQ